MGSNCGKIFPQPDTTNLCNVSVNERPENSMPGFCTLDGVGGNPYRNEFCQKMSNADEWGNGQGTDRCQYNDCNNYQAYDVGCCDGCCGIVGEGLKCERLKFTGNPAQCCLNDVACTEPDYSQNPRQCYSDTNKQNACADGKNGQPNYRNITSSDCKDVLFQYCTGTLPTDNPNSTEWLTRWTVNNGLTGSCSYALQRNMFAGTGCNGITGCDCNYQPIVPGICNIEITDPINSEGYYWAQTVVETALDRYRQQGFIIGALPGTQGYNTFQNFLYTNVCCPYAGLCQAGLQKACSNYTAQRISINPSISQFCGCHLPTPEYETYSINYNIPPECTPICNRSGVIPLVGINAEPITCKQNICLIDNVTVNLINAQVGDLNFNQLCGNCGDTQCSCVISNTTIDISNSTIGGRAIPVQNNCGSLTCSQTNTGLTGPSVVPIDCGDTTNPFTEYNALTEQADQTATKNSNILTIIIIFIILLLILLFLFFLYPRPQKIPQRQPQPMYTKNTIPTQTYYNSILDRDNFLLPQITPSTQTTQGYNSILDRPY